MLPQACPGLYCGRIDRGNDSYTDCGACPRGFRASANSICEPCLETPTFYDAHYLGFMAILLLVLEWYIIDRTMKRQVFSREVLALHFSALAENGLALLLSILVVAQPFGTLTIRSCHITRLADWYTLLFNPTPGYKHTLRCANEAAYPLYSMVFVHLSFSLVLLLLLRAGAVLHYVGSGHDGGKRSVYLTMYLIPALILLHAIFAGIFYYTFPYITIVMSIISIAYHLALRLDQRIKPLVRQSVKDPRNLTILLIHWCLHGYGIMALTQNPILLTLVPLPTAFYILTSRFTDPSKLHED